MAYFGEKNRASVGTVYGLARASNFLAVIIPKGLTRLDGLAIASQSTLLLVEGIRSSKETLLASYSKGIILGGKGVQPIIVD